MSDARPLPPRPDLEQYRKLARELHRASSETALHTWATRWVTNLARLRGQTLPTGSMQTAREEAAALVRRWRELRPAAHADVPRSLTNAQLFLAREHGFPNWPKFAEHVEALAAAHSQVAKFEAAADAIVSGQRTELETMLREDRSLIRARSLRSHRSTLLHYVSANGVEDFRQKTPGNILAITQLLLEAGADVNAESDAYGGGSTTLGLVATSGHPERAGQQIPLLQLLLGNGAHVDRADGGSGNGSTVNACLRNGRAVAAAFLADHGALLDLEGAAGVGRLEIVKSFFNENGGLRPPATIKQLADGFAWGCQYGHIEVVDFLLAHGAAASLSTDGPTGLHWAVLGGQAAIVNKLLELGAAVDVIETRFGGTPLAWALHAFDNAFNDANAERYYEVIATLVRTGASTDAFSVPQSNLRMQAAMRGSWDPNSLN